MVNIVSDYSDGIPQVSGCLIDPAGNVVFDRHAGREFYSASTIKLGVMIAAMKLVDAGELDLGQPLISTQTFPSSITGAGDYTFDPEETDPGMAPLGEPMALLEVIRRMIVVSSNEATNMIANHIGLDNVTDAFASCGAKNTKMMRLFGDYAALKDGRTITTTAYDLAITMHAVTSGRAASPEMTALMLSILEAQEYPRIGNGIDEGRSGIPWGSKSGSVTGICHDVAFFRPVGAQEPAYSFAVCTRAFGKDQGTEAIEAMSSLMIQLLVPQL